MSPRWRDRLDVLLAPGQMAVVARRRGWRSPPPLRHVVSLDAVAPTPPWRPALDQLTAWLTEQGRRGASLRVVLSDHFVRYAMLPWHGELVSRAERDSLARHLFADKYGAVSQDWHVQLAAPHYGQPTLACAIDAALRDALLALAAQHGMQLTSLQPRLAMACDTFASRLERDAVLFVHEAGRLTGLVSRDGVWQTVRSVRLGQGLWRDAWLTREVEVMGLPTDWPLYLVDCTGQVSAGDDAPFQVLSLRDRPAPASASAAAEAAS